MSDSRSPISKASWPVRFGVFVAILVIAYLIFARGVDRDLNHDEHQFLAPGAILARESLLPYRDFPLFHLPNLVFAYAAMDRLTGDPILGPKLLSISASILVAVCLLGLSLRHVPVTSAGSRLAVGCGIVGLLLFDPLFLHTTGKTWNHEVPACLLVLAILFHVESFRRKSVLWLIASALAAGLAAGCRLTYAPVLVPFALSIFLFPIPRSLCWRLAALYTVAATLALAPSLFLLTAFPEQFLFGNFEFPRLAMLDPENTRIRKTLTLWRKLRFLGKEVLLPSWPVVFGYGVIGVAPGVAWLRRRGESGFGAALVLIVLPFVLLGIFAPSRYQYQHFYALIPLLLTGLAFGISHFRSVGRTAALATVATMVLGSVAASLWTNRNSLTRSDFDWLTSGFRRERWFPARVAAVGTEIRERYPSGKVLTLAPAWPLAGGLEIFPEFATAPFCWRNARFVPAERRPGLRLIAPSDLELFLAEQLPPAILTGVEDETLEAPLVAYAQSHGYRLVKLKRKRQLWLPPVETRR